MFRVTRAVLTRYQPQIRFELVCVAKAISVANGACKSRGGNRTNARHATEARNNRIVLADLFETVISISDELIEPLAHLDEREDLLLEPIFHLQLSYADRCGARHSGG